MSTTKSKSLIFTIFAFLLIITSFIFVGCGDNTITDVTSLNGIVDSVETTTTNENLQSITVIFVAEPSSISAKYGEENLETTAVEIEDYYNDSSNVTAYSYTFNLDEITIEDYNLSPIVITCSVNNYNYRFNLSTDLISLIYPELSTETQE